MQQLVSSIERCQKEQSEGITPTFYVDTIVCPLYDLDSNREGSEFAGIVGIKSDINKLDQVERYKNKFIRYLKTLQVVNEYLSTRGIVTKGRIYFGDAGVINAQMIKSQLNLSTDTQLRNYLRKQNNLYRTYFLDHKHEFNLSNVKLEFSNITELNDKLSSTELDLYESAEKLNIVNNSGINLKNLSDLNINNDIIRLIDHHANQIKTKFRRGSSAERKSYLELIGFMLNYGLAGKGLANLSSKSDILISLDPSGTPENYRHGMYFSFLEGKGKNLAMFIPN